MRQAGRPAATPGMGVPPDMLTAVGIHRDTAPMPGQPTPTLIGREFLLGLRPQIGDPVRGNQFQTVTRRHLAAGARATLSPTLAHQGSCWPIVLGLAEHPVRRALSNLI